MNQKMEPSRVLSFNPFKTTNVLQEVLNERARQNQKWGEQNWPFALATKYGPIAETAKKNCDNAHKAGKLTWNEILTEEVMEAFAESSSRKKREELIQVAAVAVAMIECIDRRDGGSVLISK